jgi:quercetin dioxygenase-like cupin family protein
MTIRKQTCLKMCKLGRVMLYRGLLFVVFLGVGLMVQAQYNRDIVATPLLKTDTTTIGQKIVYPDYPDAEITAMKILIPPGASTGWHKHEFPVFAFILSGTLTVETEFNKVMHFSENSTFAEMIRTYHNGSNQGKEDVVLIAFYLGGKGVPLSVKKE